MKLFLGSIYDSAAESFSPPFTAVTKAKAIQAVADGVNAQGSKNDFAAHPDEHVLFELGTYETSDSTFSLHSVPVRVICLADLKKD